MTREEAIEILKNGGWWDLLIPITTIEGRSDEDKLHQAIDMAISALRSTPQLDKPLTLDQLREMDGKPAWCEDVERWVLVSVDDVGKWKGIPFALFRENGARFEWNVEDRELSLYSYPPAQQRWIPVSERLPEKGKTVLVYRKSEYVGVEESCMDRLEEIGKCTLWIGTSGWFEVTHWMPLPEPPEEG